MRPAREQRLERRRECRDEERASRLGDAVEELDARRREARGVARLGERDEEACDLRRRIEPLGRVDPDTRVARRASPAPTPGARGGRRRVGRRGEGYGSASAYSVRHVHGLAVGGSQRALASHHSLSFSLGGVVVCARTRRTSSHARLTQAKRCKSRQQARPGERGLAEAGSAERAARSGEFGSERRRADVERAELRRRCHPR